MFIHQIDDFYSANSLESWLKVLGVQRHYHFGKINPNNLNENIMDYAVRYLYPLIPDGCKILDCGCGWGGPASLLHREKQCKVTGITVSKTQYEFIKNNIKEVNPICGDLEKYIPEQKYDLLFFLESYGHLKYAKKILKNLSPYADRLLISDFFSYQSSHYDPNWMLHLHSKQEIEEAITHAGYSLKFFEETGTAQDIVESAKFWLEGIKKLKNTEINEHLKLLGGSCYHWIRLKKLKSWSIGTFYAEKSPHSKKEIVGAKKI